MSKKDEKDDRLSLLLLGKKVEGYRLIERIAIGGMGYIFRAACCEGSERQCAVKVLRPEFSIYPMMKIRFQREATILQMFDHPRIVSLQASGHKSGLGQYMCLTWLDGYSLKEKYRQERGLFSKEKIGKWFEQTSDALAAIHEKGIVHRDLKPDNIFLIAKPDEYDKDIEWNEDLCLIDFGIAVQSENRQPIEISGTPRYMAPEQIKGECVSASTDIYAFGHILVEMLTRRPVFSVAKGDQLKRAHLYEDTPTLSYVRPDLHYPEPLERFLLQMMAKAPKDRPSSIKEVNATLAPIFSDLLIEPKEGPLQLSIGLEDSLPEFNDSPTPVGIQRNENEKTVSFLSLIRRFMSAKLPLLFLLLFLGVSVGILSLLGVFMFRVFEPSF